LETLLDQLDQNKDISGLVELFEQHGEKNIKTVHLNNIYHLCWLKILDISLENNLNFLAWCWKNKKSRRSFFKACLVHFKKRHFGNKIKTQIL